jgi:hypothetical protein
MDQFAKESTKVELGLLRRVNREDDALRVVAARLAVASHVW